MFATLEIVSCETTIWTVKPDAIILKSPGTNCDGETDFCCKKVGFESRIMLLNEAVENPKCFEESHLVIFPGGFSFGDDLGGGKVFAIFVRQALLPALQAFHKKGGLILGICNGFQVMAKAGLLPIPDGKQRFTLTANMSRKFECRWIRMKVTAPNCVFLRGLTTFDLPVAHGEGRLATNSNKELILLEEDKLVALRYTDETGKESVPYPHNPNGSPGGIAGICDSTGRILGLMPHPERFNSPENHPAHSRVPRKTADGLKFFQNAFDFIKEKL